MGKLFAVVLTIITVVATAIFVMRVWWLPADISVHGPSIDHQLLETMVSSGILFVVSQLALALFVWKAGDRRDGRKIKVFPGGAVPMVVLATVLVAAEILALPSVGSTWGASISQTPPDPTSPAIDVQAEHSAF